jgi:hypothetical protein
MIPYIAKGSIKVTYYMQDGELTRDDLRIVLANNLEEAKLKYYKYWESQTSEYSVYYRVGMLKIEETLL